MPKSPGRTALRLSVIIALLALYPVSILVIKFFVSPETPPRLRGSVSLDVSSASGLCTALARVTITNRDTRTVEVERLSLLVLDGETPVLTRIEEGAALLTRLGGTRALSPGATVALEPMCLQMPEGGHQRAILASCDLRDPSDDTRAIIQTLLEGPLGSSPLTESPPPFPPPPANQPAEP